MLSAVQTLNPYEDRSVSFKPYVFFPWFVEANKIIVFADIRLCISPCDVHSAWMHVYLAHLQTCSRLHSYHCGYQQSYERTWSLIMHFKGWGTMRSSECFLAWWHDKCWSQYVRSEPHPNTALGMKSQGKEVVCLSWWVWTFTRYICSFSCTVWLCQPFVLRESLILMYRFNGS